MLWGAACLREARKSRLAPIPTGLCGRQRCTAQRGFSKRYSRSGARSRCSLFLFLAKSFSSAITSFSNTSGAGFASAREEWAERMMSVSQSVNTHA